MDAFLGPQAKYGMRNFQAIERKLRLDKVSVSFSKRLTNSSIFFAVIFNGIMAICYSIHFGKIWLDH